jgi:oxygen tolerance protein BatD
MVKKIFILFFVFGFSISVFGQGLISYISLNTDNAYIGQPVQLKVSVFTTTWFTKGVDVGNIQVDGALTVYFRSVSNSRVFSGKKYAGVDFYYNLFPTNEGIITIPALEIQVETPKEGGYKGIKRTVRTKPKTITVKGVPFGYDPNNWLVANSLNITEKWSAPLNDVKVGDVIQRSIVRSAAGTLSEFIPATKWDSIQEVSLYPKRPKVITNKSKTGVSAIRTEVVNFLFEKEGEIIIPAIEYIFWNPGTKKFYKKQITEKKIQVKPNADLAMLASIKKSLQKEKIEDNETEEDKTFLIFGFTPFDFFKYLILLLIVLYILTKIAEKLLKFYQAKETAYLVSESYAFDQVKKAIKKNDYHSFIRNSNLWLRKLEGNFDTISDFVKREGTPRLNKLLIQLNETYFKQKGESTNQIFNLLLQELKKTRKDYLTQQKTVKKNQTKNNSWLNPTSIKN